MTNREKLAALVAENAERILANGSLCVEDLNARACECSPVYPGGCDGGECAKCFSAFLDAPAECDFEYADDFFFPPNTAFVLIKEGEADGNA